jgi:signal recognition particle receptor subunit beta
MFYQDIHGIIFVIDGTDNTRINIVKEQIEKLDKDLDRKLPVVFLVNKQDIEGALNKSDVKNFLGLDKLDSNFIWTMK